MNWDKKLLGDTKWSSDIINYDQKMSVAKNIAEKVKEGDVIGFGSGSTSFLAVHEIAKHIEENHLKIFAIPTSHEIELTCIKLGIQVLSINSARPDWSFDGADEVDPYGNLIKGRGGAMYNEKLIMKCSKESFILVDESKIVSSLGSNFRVPIEIIPNSLMYVKQCLFDLGASESMLRLAKSKDGPVITENGNYILDVKFMTITDKTETAIKGITGVVESGLFWGYSVTVVRI